MFSSLKELVQRKNQRFICTDTEWPDPGPDRHVAMVCHELTPALDEWEDLKEGFEGWIENLDEDEREEMLPDWVDAYVVVGNVPNSGNYFLVPLEGAERGKVFEFEHDGFEFIERAAGFAEFVDTICTVNETLLHEILGHTRYSDGKSSVQWLCKQYLFDVGDT